MAASELIIGNMALANIGYTVPMASLTENTKAATQFNLWWTIARDYVLAAYPWPFAVQTVSLQQIPPATYQPPDYQYAYGCPADCLKGLELLSPAGRNPPSRARVRWCIRGLTQNNGTSTTRVICTDMPPGLVAALGGDGWDGAGWNDWVNFVPYGLQPGTPLPCLRYIQRVVDVTVWRPEVDVAMAWQLAAFLAIPLTQQKGSKDWAEKMAEMKIKAAAAMNINEQQMDPPRDADPQQARR